MKKFIDAVRPLSEKIFYNGKIAGDYGDVETVIYLNPTPREILALKRATEGGELRALMDIDLYVWPAHDATHSDVARALRVDGADLRLNPHSITVNDYDPDASDEDAENFAQMIKTNPSIIALYGPNVDVNIEASEGVRDWQF